MRVVEKVEKICSQEKAERRPIKKRYNPHTDTSENMSDWRALVISSECWKERKKEM